MTLRHTSTHRNSPMPKSITIALALCALLSGCLEPTPTKTETKDAQALVDAMTFVRHRSGLCFGVTTVEKVSTGGHLSMSVAMVQVDCAAVGLTG